MIIDARPGARRTLVVFGGFAEMPWRLLHALVEPFRVNLVLLRDPKRIAFVNGVASLGENYEDTIAKLREVLASLSGRRVFCLGNSLNGLAAIRYAADLGAEAAIALAGPANIMPDFMERDPRGRNQILPRIREFAPAAPLDLAEFVRKGLKPRRILWVYGEKAWDDRRHAKWMEGVSGVEFIRIRDFTAHTVLLRMIANGTADSLFSKFLGNGIWRRALVALSSR